MADAEHAHKHEVESPVAEADEFEQAPGTAAAVPIAGLAVPKVQRASGSANDPLGGTDVDPDIASTLTSRRGRGAPLPDSVAEPMGQMLGTDLSGVRVHTDREADVISRSMQAHAFTYGSDVYFTSGTYAPTTSSGQHLLAHELAHVAQNQGTVQRSVAGPTIGHAHDPAEVEADAMADRVLEGLRHQAGRVGEPDDAETSVAGTTGITAVRRQAARVGELDGPFVVRRGFLNDLYSIVSGWFTSKPAAPSGDAKPAAPSAPVSAPSSVSAGAAPSTDSKPADTGGESAPSLPASTAAPSTDTKPVETNAAETTGPAASAGPSTAAPVVVTYPRVATLGKGGKEKVNLEKEADEAEATAIIDDIAGSYGIELSSATSVEAIKHDYSRVLAEELAKLQTGIWQMKELRALQAALVHFAPILGAQRANSAIADKAQGVTTIGRVEDTVDVNGPTGTIKPGVMGEYFASKKDVALFDTVTNLKDRRYVREGKAATDNETTLEANAIHEMSHGLIEPVEIANWIAAMDFWADRYTPSGKAGAELPPTRYGQTGGAGEDLAESVAIFFVNKPMLEKVAPKRAAFIAKVVASWTPAKAKDVVKAASTASGTGE
ncbi:MAG TPA: DUF4157 domain-containing protein [Jatrophihabitantaceae bacterium]|jgi:hypothetical protein